jgi:nucleoid-associated protein YejK
MYHYDPATALEELREEALLPNPVHVRDMVLRTSHSAEEALDLNRRFQAYQAAFAVLASQAAELLQALSQAPKRD